MAQKQTMTPLSKYHSWSLLDPKPVCYYDFHTSTHLAVWNGIYMTRNQALMLASEKFMHIWPTPTMKERAWKEFTTAYYAGAFGHRDWDGILSRIDTASGHYNFLQKCLAEHLKKMPSHDGKTVLSWFNLHKEQKEWNT